MDNLILFNKENELANGLPFLHEEKVQIWLSLFYKKKNIIFKKILSLIFPIAYMFEAAIEKKQIPGDYKSW